MRLKNLHIYALPDGREFVAETSSGDGPSLYSEAAWELRWQSDFRVGEEGQLLRYDQPSAWHVSHLSDTGRAAEYPKSHRLL